MVPRERKLSADAQIMKPQDHRTHVMEKPVASSGFTEATEGVPLWRAPTCPDFYGPPTSTAVAKSFEMLNQAYFLEHSRFFSDFFSLLPKKRKRAHLRNHSH